MAKPELAVAPGLKSAALAALVGIAGKLIVCATFVTVNVCVTEVAAK